MPPRLPKRPETMPYSHSQPPLTLTLPNIKSINRINPNNENHSMGLHMFGSTPTTSTIVNGEIKEDEQSQYNKFYIQLLENINLDDEDVIHELIEKLLELRTENDKLITKLWYKIENISDLKGTKSNNPNSLLYDTKLTNLELLKILKEQRLYNVEISKVLENYENSIDLILKTLIDSNTEISKDLIDNFENGFKEVDDHNQRLWNEWFKFNELMDNITEFDNKIIKSLSGL